MTVQPPWRARRGPSRLGLALTFGLLFGLLVLRQVVPWSPLWIDLAALVCAGVVLLMLKRRTARRR